MTAGNGPSPSGFESSPRSGLLGASCAPAISGISTGCCFCQGKKSTGKAGRWDTIGSEESRGPPAQPAMIRTTATDAMYRFNVLALRGKASKPVGRAGSPTLVLDIPQTPRETVLACSTGIESSRGEHDRAAWLGVGNDI